MRKAYFLMTLLVMAVGLSAKAEPPVDNPATQPATAPAITHAQMDNPVYKEWARFKPGTWATSRREIENGGKAASHETYETTATLISITPEKAVLQRKRTVDVSGQKTETTEMVDVPAEVDAGADMPMSRPAPLSMATVEAKVSTEVVDVQGVKLACRVTESKMTFEGGNATTKEWRSESVPGQLVKMEQNVDGHAKVMMKVTLVAFEVK